MTENLDVLIVGSGVAGLTAAVRAATIEGLRVGIVTKGDLSQSTTRWAQGGIAAVLGSNEDSTDLHLADTLAAGAGMCDRTAVRCMVDEGPGRVEDLVSLGARFDVAAGGELSRVREGGHSAARVVHAGGAATGAEIERALVAAVTSTAAALFERHFATELVVEGGRCRGVSALDPAGERTEIQARHTVLATGGAGQMFAVTTNPGEATGDGLAMALRAGVAVADVEFMQFHPTALHHPAMPRPLLSEALRGHGALLRDARGDRFVDEMSPRDVVSRAMARRMAEQGVDHLWLDATGLDDFAVRFPTIARSLAEVGLDPASDWLPIAPAAHHISGGVLTDLDGATLVPCLWACGEVACTGVHGANRLASNSLLEGMVFGARTVEAIAGGREGPLPRGALRAVLEPEALHPLGGPGDPVPVRPLVRSPASPASPACSATGVADLDVTKARASLQAAMTAGAGVVRSADSLAAVGAALESVESQVHPAIAPSATSGPLPSGTGRVGMWELANLVACADALVGAATERRESRGSHARSDFPDVDPSWRVRLVQ